VLNHEHLHAAGYDHRGSTAMQRMLEAWKAGPTR
jgi:ssRNA-specific RNase YbeY (16S rRNA maturation enzyme)